MDRYDAVIIGGGLLGCFAARELMRRQVSAVLVEKREDVCTGISRANSAIVYPGYDHKPGTLKARLTLSANADFDTLCRELSVPFSRCGSLMVSCGERGDRVLKNKYENGRLIGVPGLRLLRGDEAREMEPGLSPAVRSALYAPTAGTTDPWALCYAALENARANGCDYRPGTEVLAIRREAEGYALDTGSGTIFARSVINCAGLCADGVRELLFAPRMRIRRDGADYAVFARDSVPLGHILQQETETGEKGVTLVPTVGGTVLMESPPRPPEREESAVTENGITRMREEAARVFPALDWDDLIRCFAAVRPNPYGVVLREGAWVPDGKHIGSFVIESAEPGFVSLIGVKTPGLTCARELGALAAQRIADYLQAEENTGFDPERRAQLPVRALDEAGRRELIRTDGDFGEVLCLCEGITVGEVLRAIRAGAVTTDGVKRRCGAMLGVCQGSRCQWRIAELIARESGIPVEAVTASGGSSLLYGGRHGEL